MSTDSFFIAKRHICIRVCACDGMEAGSQDGFGERARGRRTSINVRICAFICVEIFIRGPNNRKCSRNAILRSLSEELFTRLALHLISADPLKRAAHYRSPRKSFHKCSSALHPRPKSPSRQLISCLQTSPNEL